MFTLEVYKIVFIIELLLSEFLYMSHLKKRKHFIIRLSIVYLACLLIAIFIPVINFDAISISGLFLILTLFSIIGLCFTYNERFLNILYCVVAAYTTRHLAFRLYSLYLNIINGSGSIANNIYDSGAINDIEFNEFTILSIFGYVCIYFIIFVVSYTFFGRKIGSDGDFEMKKPSLLILVILILFIDIFLNSIVIYNSKEENFANERTLFISMLCNYLYNILCCFFTLFIQYVMIGVKKLQKELSIVNHLWEQDREQFKISKENIDLINRKCHDLKYQIGKIFEPNNISSKQRKEIENVISIYDSMIKTNNEALDVIFAEKSLLCRENNIKLNCMIDGAKLSFMEVGDIYSLFGNLIDNAIEAVEHLSDNEKKIISVNVYEKDDLLHIDMSNYYEGKISFTSDGLPNTTKEQNGYHGYGLRSVFLIVKSYNGKILLLPEDNIFAIEITIPINR